MDRLLVDTNIVLDLLGRRAPWFEEARALFVMAENGTIQLCLSALTIPNTAYLIAKQLGQPKTRDVLRKLSKLVTILPLDEAIIHEAIDADFRDFEDGLQHVTAVRNNLLGIVTRNKKDFANATIPVFTAREYLLNMK